MRSAPSPRFAALVLGALVAGGPLAAGRAVAHEPPSREIADLSRRIETGAASAAECLRRGELRRLRGEWDLALADYERAARLDPALREVDLCRAALWLDRGDPRRARAALDRFLAADPDHAEALAMSARAWTALGRPGEAVRDYDRLLERAERPAPDHCLARARIVAARGPQFLEEALRGLDRGAARLGPVVALESYAIDLEVERGAFDAALARLERIAPQFGRREAVLEQRGRILEAAGRPGEARRAYAEALAALETIPPERRPSPAARDREARLRTSIARLDVPAEAGAPAPGDR